MFSTNNNSDYSEVEIVDPYTMYGECRCCMAKGQHRDVTKEYYYNNIKEVYKDIFLECFNLSLTPHNLISPLICENCVNRLRDATSFRMMVAATEEQLLNAVIFKSDPDNDTEFVDVTGPQNFTTEVKIESDSENIEIETDILQDEISLKDGERMNDGDEQMNYGDVPMNYFDDDDDDDDDWSDENELVIDESRGDTSSDEFCTDEDLDDCASTYSSITVSTTSAMDDEPCEIVEGETKLLARFPRSVQPLPKRKDLAKICPVYDEHLRKIEDSIVNPKSLEWFLNTPDLKDTLISDRQALALNATTIFTYSTATAFKTKTRNGYPCFYCREVFKPDKLREHQEKHSKSSIYKLLSKYNADEFVVYADITNLKCGICKKKIKHIIDLRNHLSEKHSRKIYTTPDRVIPFKLKDTDFECQVCGQKFETFGAVEKHMNTHYGSFMCEACGAGFITKHRLAVHHYTQHKDEKVICTVCKKSFRNQMKYRLHYEGVHKNMKKFKCTKCPEKFIDYFTRQKHLVDAHNETPVLYKCSVCDKGFNRRYGLSSHVKRCHSDQRDIKCEMCPYSCHTNSELRDHMVKHGSTQSFECTVCKRTYSRNRSLVMHMKTHNKEN